MPPEEQVAVEKTAASESAPDDDSMGFAALYRLSQTEQKKEDEEYDQYAKKPQYTEDLNKAYDSYASPETFQAGDRVQWKPLLKNRRFPFYGRPAVILEVLETPVYKDKQGRRTPEPLDLVVGFLSGSQEFSTFMVCSRRLTAWEGSD